MSPSLVASPCPHAFTALRRRLSFAVLTALVTLLTVLVPTPPASAAVTTTEARIASAVLKLINSERAAHGVAPLRANWRLHRSARRHNLVMAQHNVLSHQVSGEASIGTRVRRSGYRWTRYGENIASCAPASQACALGRQRAMYNERPPNNGHRRNILSRRLRHVGVDVYVDPRGRLWLTEDFGHP